MSIGTFRTLGNSNLPKDTFFINFFFESERVYKWGRGREREREGDTESDAGPRLQTVSTRPDAGLELTNLKIVT